MSPQTGLGQWTTESLEFNLSYYIPSRFSNRLGLFFQNKVCISYRIIEDETVLFGLRLHIADNLIRVANNITFFTNKFDRKDEAYRVNHTARRQPTLSFYDTSESYALLRQDEAV